MQLIVVVEDVVRRIVVEDLLHLGDVLVALCRVGRLLLELEELVVARVRVEAVVSDLRAGRW
jgi:hypothetical protein